MYRLCATLLFVFLSGSSGVAKSRHVMFRVHAEANPADTAAFSTSVKAQLSGKDVSIERAARINERDVQAFLPYSLGNGQFGALFQLDEHGRLTLDALSVERRGGYLFIFINGRPITELQIDKRVTDGQIYIPSGLTATDIALMQKEWRVIGKRRR